MNMSIKNILFALALPALIIVQTTHSMELPGQYLSQNWSRLPTEIQNKIIGYALGTTESWEKITKNKKNNIVPIQESTDCCQNCVQHGALKYQDSSSFKAKIISKIDLPEDYWRDNDIYNIEPPLCHSTLNLLAVPQNNTPILHIFNKKNLEQITFVQSCANIMTFHPTKPILVTTSGNIIDIFDFNKTPQDDNRLQWNISTAACKIASFKKPFKTISDGIISISFNSTGSLLNIISNDATIDTFQHHTDWTLDQLLLNKIIKMGLEVKKPSKKITSIDSLLTKIASMFKGNSSALLTAWEKLPSEIQKDLWRNAQQFIQKHGKDYAPAITENELDLIMNGCALL